MELNWTLFGQWITFFLLLFLLTKFLYTPLSKVMQSRTAKIQEGLDAAEKARHDLAEAKAFYETQQVTAKTEAQEIIKNAQQRAVALKEEIVSQAKEESNRVVQKAREDVQLEWEKARMELKREMADIIFIATGKIIGEVIDRDRHMALVTDVVKNVKANGV